MQIEERTKGNLFPSEIMVIIKNVFIGNRRNYRKFHLKKKTNE
jgi:hypothetical protein